MDSEEYRVKAAACLLAAENTKLPNARERWLAMAQALNRLADEADRMRSGRTGVAIANRLIQCSHPGD